MIRKATRADGPAIKAIWNNLINSTTVTFNPVAKTDADIATYLQDHPVFVADVDGVVGYASYGPFRSGAGYARTAEHSIVLTQAAQGHGHGRALMATVMQAASAEGITSLIAGISAENAQGVAFHHHLGFVQVGLIPGAGYKFGRAIDLVLMQKQL